MITVLLDASVLMSALYSKTGASAAILELIHKQKIQGYVSSLILKEVLRNLQKKGTHDMIERLGALLATNLLKKVSFKSEAELDPYRHLTVTKDVHVLAAAAKAKVHYLLTLDQKHLLSVDQALLGYRVLTPGGFLQSITAP